MSKKHAVSLCLFGALAGCATGPERDPRDPLEPLNRTLYSFNGFMDRNLVKPAAEFYTLAVPSPVTESVSNFFSNLEDIAVFGNDLFQLQFQSALQDWARLVYNTVFGLGGLFDVASTWDLPKHDRDFGQTLGYWGVGPGPYLVLPFLGPRTVRDTMGWVADSTLDPMYRITPTEARLETTALHLVDTRANLLGASRVLEQAAIDPYLFVRDAYLQHRESLIQNAQSPD